MVPRLRQDSEKRPAQQEHLRRYGIASVEESEGVVQDGAKFPPDRAAFRRIAPRCAASSPGWFSNGSHWLPVAPIFAQHRPKVVPRSVSEHSQITKSATLALFGAGLPFQVPKSALLCRCT